MCPQSAAHHRRLAFCWIYQLSLPESQKIYLRLRYSTYSPVIQRKPLQGSLIYLAVLPSLRLVHLRLRTPPPRLPDRRASLNVGSVVARSTDPSPILAEASINEFGVLENGDKTTSKLITSTQRQSVCGSPSSRVLQRHHRVLRLLGSRIGIQCRLVGFARPPWARWLLHPP